MQEPALQPASLSAWSALQLIHIPKTGGTTLEEVGLLHGANWSIHRKDWPGGYHGGKLLGTWQPCSSWHIPPAAYTSIAHVDAYAGTARKFAVVRHPYTRAISEYAFTRAISGGECSAAGLNAAVQRIDSRISASIAMLEAGFPLINETALWRAGTARWQVISDGPGSDCHWLPQWLYVGDDAGVTVLHTEALADEFRTMLLANGDGDFDVSELDSHRRSLTAPYWHGKRDQACELEVGALDDASRSILQRLYRADFERFGYER